MFLIKLGYSFNSFDDVNHPELKIYYKCYRLFHHSHSKYGDDIITPMTIDESVDIIKNENLDIQIM